MTVREAPERVLLVDPSSREWSPAWKVVLLFSLLSLYCGIRSQGFIAADACTHYLYARFAFREPTRLVDVWARPLVTALYAPAAVLGGRVGARCVSLVVALACGWVAMALARRQGVGRPTLALLFTLGEPLLFLHSFGEMTELPFALLLGLATLAFHDRKLLIGAFLTAWLPLARPEGFGFVVLAGAALAVAVLRSRQRVRAAIACLILPIPLLLWDVSGWLLLGRHGPWWGWLRSAWPYSDGSLYGRGNLLAFVGQLPVIVSPLVLPATLLGLWFSFTPEVPLEEDRRARTLRRLTGALPLFVLTIHSLLYGLGRLSSFGEVRYLLVTAPFWGVLSARGWEWMFGRFAWPHPFRWAAGAVLLPVAFNLIHPVVPIALPPDWQAAQRIAERYRAAALYSTHPRLMAAHSALFYFLDVSPCDPNRTCAWDRQTLTARPAGVLLVWEPIYSTENASTDHSIRLEDVYAAGWRHLEQLDFIAENPVHPTDGARDPADPHHHWQLFVSDPINEQGQAKPNSPGPP